MQYNSLRQNFSNLFVDFSIDAFVIVSQDPFGNEYLGAHWALRDAISHFHGSAGTYLLTKKQDYLLTDSRYWDIAQKLAQTAPWVFIPQKQSWIDETIRILHHEHIQSCGFDPLAMSYHDAQTFIQKAQEYGIHVRAIPNAYSHYWIHRPQIEKNSAFLLDDFLCIPPRSTRLARLQKLREHLLPNKAFLVTSPSDIAWLLHVRAHTKDCNPVLRAYTYINHEQCILFTQQDLEPHVLQTLNADGIQVYQLDELTTFLTQKPSQSIYIDQQSAPYYFSTYPACIMSDLPIAQWRCQKEDWEIHYIKKAMIADAIAHAEWQSWLDQCYQENKLPSESKIAEKIIAFRKESQAYLSESFPPIVASGAHASMPHYETPKHDTTPISEGLLLVDTGGHYLYGTTDTTRMIPIGCLSEDRKEKCTLVLKGMIALSCATFSDTTPASELDRIARQPLQEKGLDFGHGTGHGIGFVHSVHEGPYRISPRFHQPLIPSLLLSNEPGFYASNQFGVRIENTLLTIQQNGHLTFQTMNLIPIRQECLALHLLTEERIQWLNSYHQHILEQLSQVQLSKRASQWLIKHTKAIQSFNTSIPTNIRLWWM